MPQAFVLDVDGTLVDSNYQHTIAWQRAFRDHGIAMPAWRLHRAVGIGGDRYVAAVADEAVERRVGEKLREAHSDHYEGLIGEVAALPGASEVVHDLARRGHAVVVATSANEDELNHYLELLGVADVIDDAVHADTVQATKPAPDLIEAALERVGTRDAVMVGDSRWDCEAASRAGIGVIGLLSGGFGADELHDAGALAVYDDAAELCTQLDAALARAAAATTPAGPR